MLRARFDLDKQAEIDLQPRFNIAPTDPVLAIRERAGEREPGQLRWGLVPPGKAPKQTGRPIINLRAESIRSGAFNEAFRERRCLVPADGFYEWRRTDDGKVPVWISLPENELFAFAGLWSQSRDDDGGELTSCTIVTCEPTEQIRPVHNRMPVILPRDGESTWLAPEADPQTLHGLLRPGPEELELREVVSAVNDVREDGPHLLEPHKPPAKLF